MFRRDFLKLASLLFVRIPKREKLKAGERKLVKLSDIIIDESLNVRGVKLKASSDLVQSIKELGIVMPLIITNKYKLVAGFRRADAAKILGIKEVPIVCCGSAEDDVIYFANFSQNSYRLVTTDDF